MNWESIDTAPLDGRRILVTVAGPSNYWPEIAEWDSKHAKWLKQITDNGARLFVGITPTHWMHLPDSPPR